MRDGPFTSLAELDAYIAGNMIECLECGRHFKSLATHIPRVHGMSHDDYRDKWGIPRRYPLAGQSTRAVLSNQMRDMIATGRVTHDHLPGAVEKSRDASRRRKSPVDAALQSTRVADCRPGDHHHLPPGAKRAGGRDADRAREYQRAYRALKNGDDGPMQRYREFYCDT